MKSSLRIIGLVIGLSLAPFAFAGESSARITAAARAGSSVTALSCFQAAMENATKAGPPIYTGTQIPVVQKNLKRDVLIAMDQAKKLTDAKPLIIKYAPEILPDLAKAYAKSQDAKEALEIIKLGKDDAEKLQIETAAFAGLIESNKLASAEQYLSTRAKNFHAGMLYAQLATVQAQASDREGYQKNIIKGAEAAQGVQQPQLNDILHDLAAAQAAAGDYADSRETQRSMEGNVYGKMEELVLAAQLRRGEVKPADAYGMIRMNGAAPVLNVILEIQLKDRDLDGVSKTLDLLRERRMAFQFTDIPVQVMDCYFAAGKVKEAEVLIENFKDVVQLATPASQARMYGRLARNQFTANNKTDYQRLMNLAIEKTREIRDLGEASSFAMPESSDILGELAKTQIELRDFPTANQTIVLIKDPIIKQKCIVQSKTAELATTGKFEEAEIYAKSLEDPMDRVAAYLTVGVELAK